MSPAATRRYVVSFTDYAVHETVVLADSKDAAIAKARAIYEMNGLADFHTTAVEGGQWEATILPWEVQS
ncbi:hypothetical protein BwSF12_54960 [Bradyrhizobium ottawaense]|uniref:hypothetical protein n=1 Tax=Bradyrhizobium ottawaense TaxID=931866 RepID=UPI0027D678DD|nr:hypothetical protein BwSF12_54960 [Bradyrhizobium ottawaense]GMO95674.1 hypothetical protein BwSF19_76030 [Bradyrhizobium ottawaense]